MTPGDSVVGNAGGPYVLGLDVGTSSVRAILYDRLAFPVSGVQSHAAYTPETTPDGGVTVDPEVLTKLVFSVLDTVAAAARVSATDVAAVGFSCFWHSLLALDADGQPLTPVFLWADTRPASVVPRLALDVDTVRLRQRTGAGLHASYWPAKLVWLNQIRPSILDSAHHLVSYGEYLLWLLLGQFRVSTSMASGSGLFNIGLCGWDWYACSLLPPAIVEKLSTVDDSPLIGLRSGLDRRWPALAGAAWFPAAGDGVCSNVGVGAVTSDTMVVTIGTSSALRAVIEQPAHASAEDGASSFATGALWNYRLDRRRGVVGGALGEGGNLIAWVHENLRLARLDQAENEVSRRQPDAAGLTILPFIAGERSPNWTAGATAVISGLTLNATALDVLQAAMESVAYQLRIVLDDLVAALGGPEVVIGAGAAIARSPVWTQIVANVLECDIAVSKLGESSSRGAAALALETLGKLRLREIDPVIERVVRPTGPSAPYRAARERQQALYDRIIDRT